MPEHPMFALKNGAGADIELIIGTNSDPSAKPHREAIAIHVRERHPSANGFRESRRRDREDSVSYIDIERDDLIVVGQTHQPKQRRG